MSLIIIAAISENNVIGKGDTIPWRMTKEDREKYQGDMDRFRDLRTGHPVIIGRKTYLSIPSKFRPFQGSRNIVLSRDLEFVMDGVETARSLEEAIELCGNETAYVAGGEQIYKIFLPLASRMEITRIHRDFEGDVFFPKVKWSEWKVINRELREGYSFLSYVRK